LIAKILIISCLNLTKNYKNNMINKTSNPPKTPGSHPISDELEKTKKNPSNPQENGKTRPDSHGCSDIALPDDAFEDTKKN
jgi:hypothetical protein